MTVIDPVPHAYSNIPNNNDTIIIKRNPAADMDLLHMMFFTKTTMPQAFNIIKHIAMGIPKSVAYCRKILCACPTQKYGDS